MRLANGRIVQPWNHCGSDFRAYASCEVIYLNEVLDVIRCVSPELVAWL